MRRRTFLLGSLAVAGLSACGSDGGSSTSATQRTADVGATRKYGSTTLTRGAASADAPNVLFISIDDCNDWLGFLNNHPGTHTPNLDALAAESLVFTKAYTPAPMCLPARTAVMFGRAPYETGVYDHSDPSRAAFNRFAPDHPSLIDDFWAAGYRNYGVGKIFHGPHEERWDDYFRQEWYAPLENRDDGIDPAKYDPDWLSPYDGQPIGNAEGMSGAIVDYGPSGKTAEDDPDGVGTQWAIDRLRDHDGGPFFLGHGVYMPHEPWRLPQQFFDLHPIDEVELPPMRDDDLDDLGPYAREEIVDPGGAFAALEASGKWREGVQAYQAAISYADWCVGQVLDELRSGPHADNTIVAVWSDHGYHLGEKLHLRKFTLWERATRVPLVLNVPGRYDEGQEVDVPVALADIGPTLLELCDAESATYAEGTSLVPIVDDPGRADDRPPISTWLEGNYAVRRGPYRYIRYRTGETELYDVDADPNEFDNLTSDPAYAAQKAELDAYLPAPTGP